MLHNMAHTLSPCHINSMDIFLISKSRQQLKLNRSMKDKSNNEKKPNPISFSKNYVKIVRHKTFTSKYMSACSKTSP